MSVRVGGTVPGGREICFPTYNCPFLRSACGSWWDSPFQDLMSWVQSVTAETSKNMTFPMLGLPLLALSLLYSPPPSLSPSFCLSISPSLLPSFILTSSFFLDFFLSYFSSVFLNHLGFFLFDSLSCTVEDTVNQKSLRKAHFPVLGGQTTQFPGCGMFREHCSCCPRGACIQWKNKVRRNPKATPLSTACHNWAPVQTWRLLSLQVLRFPCHSLPSWLENIFCIS